MLRFLMTDMHYFCLFLLTFICPLLQDYVTTRFFIVNPSGKGSQAAALVADATKQGKIRFL